MSDKEISLESLLDAPTNSNEGKKLELNANAVKVDDATDLIDYPKVSQQKQSIEREIGIELLSLLKDQDCHNIFYTPLIPAYAPHVTSIDSNCIQKIEREFILSKNPSFNSLLSSLTKLFESIIDSSHKNSVHYSESSRLLRVIKDYEDHIDKSLLKADSDVKNNQESEKTDFNFLRILNPDNQGHVKEGHKIQPLIQDAKRLDFSNGHGLTVGGCYREDRRNSVIPYSYLDYGPYYSFGPVYDSGSSNCTEDSNNLLLGTSWLPPRFLDIKFDDDKMDIYDLPTKAWDDSQDWEKRSNQLKSILKSVLDETSDINDMETIELLKIFIEDSLECLEKTRQLDEIIHERKVDDDFHLYLANALTKDLVRETRLKEANETKNQNKNDIIISNEESRKAYAKFADKLEEMYSVLMELYNTQYTRIGTIPNQEEAKNPLGSFISNKSQEQMLCPCEKEFKLAEKFRLLAVETIKELKPSDICSSYSIRKALNFENHIENGIPDDFVLPKESSAMIT